MGRVEVYGVNHSLWVQVVLLGLHEKQIPYTITGVPPWETFKECGVLMPVLMAITGTYKQSKYWKSGLRNGL